MGLSLFHGQSVAYDRRNASACDDVSNTGGAAAIPCRTSQSVCKLLVDRAMDSFPVLARPGVFGVYAVSSIGSLSPGSLFIAASNNTVHLSIQLEQSPDILPTTWTNAGPPVEWSMPVATNKSFYRVGIGE